MSPEKAKITKHFYPINNENKKNTDCNPESVKSKAEALIATVKQSRILPGDEEKRILLVDSIDESSEIMKSDKNHAYDTIVRLFDNANGFLVAVNNERKNSDPLNNL